MAGTIAGISGSVRGVPSMQLEVDAATLELGRALDDDVFAEPGFQLLGGDRRGQGQHGVHAAALAARRFGLAGLDGDAEVGLLDHAGPVEDDAPAARAKKPAGKKKSPAGKKKKPAGKKQSN